MDDRFSYYATAMAVDGANILLSLRDSVVFSHDNAQTWKTVSSLPGYAVLVHNTHLFIWRDGLYRSLDTGATWTRVFSNNLSSRLNAIASNAHSIFISIVPDVFRSDDEGNSWVLLPNNDGWWFL